MEYLVFVLVICILYTTYHIVRYLLERKQTRKSYWEYLSDDEDFGSVVLFLTSVVTLIFFTCFVIYFGGALMKPFLPTTLTKP